MSSDRAISATFIINEAPNVNAGPDQNLTLPAVATLNGTVEDDGHPDRGEGGFVTTLWTEVSGPGAVTFGNPIAIDTTASFSEAGSYVLQLTADDGELSTSDLVTITVNPVNGPPTVDAGLNQTVSLVTGVVLNGTVIDDGLPNPPSAVTTTWSLITGPGTTTFENPNEVNTTANFSAPGVYVLSLNANDSALNISDEVTITVLTVQCQTQTGLVDNLLTFPLTITDATPTTLELLSSSPEGATFDPPLPFTGSPPSFTTTFAWTPTSSQIGMTQVTLRATDAATNQNVFCVDITVRDPQEPNGEINTPSTDQSILVGEALNFTGTATDPDNTTPFTHLWTFGSSSGIPNSTAADPGLVSFNIAGTFTVTYLVTDADGLADSSPATVLITVNTDNAPVVTPPAPLPLTATTTVLATDPRIQTFLNAATATDDIDGALTTAHDAPASFPFGTTTVTFTATDSAGNIGEATSTVTVAQDGAPVVTPPVPLTLTASAGVPASDPRIQTFLTGATASDEIDGALTPSHDAPDTFPFGTTTVTFTATDSAGNTSTATATVMLTQDMAPVVTPPAPLALTATAPIPATDPQIQAFLTGTTVIDDIDSTVPLTHDAPATFPFGITTVTFTATDSAGSTTQASSTVTVTEFAVSVNSTSDSTDANPGDEVCETSPGNGICTLRAAIQEANASEGEQTITLAPGTYSLSLSGSDEDNAATGDLDITGDLIIVGNTSDPGSVIISGNGLDRVFDLPQTSPNVTIRGVTIQGGNIIGSTGGGIRNVAGNLTIENSVVTNNQSDGSGGGISHLNGTLAIQETSVNNNTSQGRGGGIQAQDGTVAISSNSQFTGNQANFGGGISTGDADVTVTNSTMTGNTATGGGGGIYKFLHLSDLFGGSGPVVRLENTTLQGNLTNDCEGTVVNVGNNTIGNSDRCTLQNP